MLRSTPLDRARASEASGRRTETRPAANNDTLAGAGRGAVRPGPEGVGCDLCIMF